MKLIEAWEIDYIERSRRVHEALEREFLEIPVGPGRKPEREMVPSIYEIQIDQGQRDDG